MKSKILMAAVAVVLNISNVGAMSEITNNTSDNTENMCMSAMKKYASYVNETHMISIDLNKLYGELERFRYLLAEHNQYRKNHNSEYDDKKYNIITNKLEEINNNIAEKRKELSKLNELVAQYNPYNPSQQALLTSNDEKDQQLAAKLDEENEKDFVPSPIDVLAVKLDGIYKLAIDYLQSKYPAKSDYPAGKNARIQQRIINYINAPQNLKNLSVLENLLIKINSSTGFFPRWWDAVTLNKLLNEYEEEELKAVNKRKKLLEDKEIMRKRYTEPI
jgi:hypothetical protein